VLRACEALAYGCTQTTVLVTHGVHHLSSADKVIVMDAGIITHFGSFEEMREADATFALASAAGDPQNRAVAIKASATAATVVDEEEDEELQWTSEPMSRRAAYTFYMKCTGVLRGCGLFVLIAVWNAASIFAPAYLSSA
jgi:ABC-type sugar transport system ATPase subunit